MARFIFDLSDEQRAALESKRAQLGMRSMADVLRHWIDLGEDAPNSPRWSDREADVVRAQPKTPLEINRIAPADGLRKGAVAAPAYKAEQEALNKRLAAEAAKAMAFAKANPAIPLGGRPKPTLVPNLPLGNIKKPMQKTPKSTK